MVSILSQRLLNIFVSIAAIISVKEHILIFSREVFNRTLLSYFSLTASAVIGQFSGPYSAVQPVKFKAVFVAKMFRDLSPSVLNVFSKYKFKTLLYF